MYELFFHGIQQDLKLLCVAPVVCAIFRVIFIAVYGHYTLADVRRDYKKFYHSFRYGFWWGMDWNAYVLLYSMVLVSIPASFVPAMYDWGDTLRVLGLAVWLIVLYCAFVGKMIFYYHYHDIYNHLIWLAHHANKRNLLDIFFNQNHGLVLIVSLVPYLAVTCALSRVWLMTPTLPYPEFPSAAITYFFNVVTFLAVIAIFYFCRFGGTFKHQDKPEWDEIPVVVKEDIFMAKATVDDMCALEIVWRHPMNELLKHSDDTAAPLIDGVMPRKYKNLAWQKLPMPIDAYRRVANGARIKPPKHIFFLLAESYEQAPMDPIYRNLHIAEGGHRFIEQPHTLYIKNFLSGGTRSRTSLVALFLGIYDAELEINENQNFWHGTVPTRLPEAMRGIGYRSYFWYGGEKNAGNLMHFLPSVGFDGAFFAPDICGPDAPRTWVGVYDHVFLDEAARRIEAMDRDDDSPVLHFIYTTSNHGPYKMPLADYGFEAEKIFENPTAKLMSDHAMIKKMGTYWYSDWALFRFIDQMKERYPDALFIVTGDHSVGAVPLGDDLIARKEPTIREQVGTFFAMQHPELESTMFAGNTIASHMNIMPTLVELLAPKGHEYRALFPSMTEHIDHIVTPYHWLTEKNMGLFKDARYQSLEVTQGDVPLREDDGRWTRERDGWCELSGWLARHPELLNKM
ncbi:MAG: LTA synthase family protein [Selenomonadaceae bacterium]